jgi:HK97 family phage major capsid protein
MTVVNKNKNAKQNEAPKQPSNQLEKLQTRMGEIAAEAQVIHNTAAADNGGRDLTEEELAKIDSLNAEATGIEKQISALNIAAELQNKANEPGKRRSVPDDLDPEGGEGGAAPAAALPVRPARSITGGDGAGLKPGMFGFRSLGAFAMAAKATQMGKPDQRIMNAPSTYGSEGVNQDGGFLVPPDFRQQIKQLIESEESLAGYCDQQTTDKNSITLPLDKVSPWDTSTGVRVNWTGEGGAITPTKPDMSQLETKLNKVSALVPVTEELLEDVPALTSWLTTKVPQKFNSELNNVIINGSGVGKPLGLLNAGCKVTQAAVAAQGANTVKMANVLAMHARLYAPLRKNAIWVINQDVEPQLQGMVVDGTSPAYPAYLPPGGLSQKPYGTLMGLPVMPIEAAQTLGTEGDIILADLSQYLLAMKTSGIRSDVSIHLYFDSGHVAFRFEMRVGGQPYWPAAISRKNGSNTLSPFITLNSTRT